MLTLSFMTRFVVIFMHILVTRIHLKLIRPEKSKNYIQKSSLHFIKMTMEIRFRRLCNENWQIRKYSRRYNIVMEFLYVTNTCEELLIP